MDLTLVLLRQFCIDQGELFGEEMGELEKAMWSLEESFYKPEILGSWCDEEISHPKRTKALLQAYKRDLKDPFAEAYRLESLKLDPSFGIVQNLNDLKVSGRFNEVVYAVRLGKIRFEPLDGDHYRYSIKSHLRKAITNQVSSMLFDALHKQTGIRLDSIKEINESWTIEPRELGFIGNYLTISTARRIFVLLPKIKFIPKN